MKWKGHVVFAGGILVITACWMGQGLPDNGTPGNDAQAVKELEGDLAKLRQVRTLEEGFVCRKDLATLDVPLVSAGQLWIRKADAKGRGGALRLETELPYESVLILADGKVYGRSQHETQWSTASQAAKPGMTLVMVQLGNWSTGDAGKLAETYSVALAPAGTVVPESPAVGSEGARKAMAGDDVYVLTPRDKEMAAAVKEVQVAVDRETGRVASIEASTPQGDAVRYWFYGVKVNGNVPAERFKAGGDLVGKPAGR